MDVEEIEVNDEEVEVDIEDVEKMHEVDVEREGVVYLIAAGAGVEVDVVQLQELHTEGALGGLVSGHVQTGGHGGRQGLSPPLGSVRYQALGDPHHH